MSIPERRAQMAAYAASGEHIEPHGFERWAADPDTQAWLKARCTPHPNCCFGQGVSRLCDPSTLPVQRDFILCDQHRPSAFEAFHERYRDDPGWQCHLLDCLHDAMIEQPDALVAILDRDAAV